MSSPDPLHIVQVVRHVHPFAGSSGVAFYLREAFDRLGVPNSLVNLTSKQHRYRSRILDKTVLFWDMLRFSVSGTLRLRDFARRAECVTIVHGDAIGGDIYIDHGLHKAVVMQKPSMFLRNPMIHPFIFVREELRHRLKTYRYIVSLSDYSERMLLRYYPWVRPDQIIRIPNGIDLVRFSMPRNPEPVSGLRLIFVGHEFERKGLRHVIEALALLPNDVMLTVVGGYTEDIDAHKAMAASHGVADRVVFLGRRADVEILLAEHDLLCLPARFESWQLVVVEAMAAGVPVLGTAVGCVPEVVRDGENGYVIEASARSIADKVQIVLADMGRLPAMRAAARTTAVDYSWDKIAQRYLSLAERVRAERDHHGA